MEAKDKRTEEKEHEGFALKFLSGKHQGTEFPLQNGSEIIIGRASDIPGSMVLDEEKVSRKHARLLCAGSNLVLQDLGSTNGTFVNGERINAARLEEGDRILIGSSILKLIVRTGDEDTHEAHAQSRMARKAERNQGFSMSGRLEDVPMPDVLQLIGSSRQSGVLKISAGRSGRVYIREGQIFHAEIDGEEHLGPRKALSRLVGWEEGAFELGPPAGDEIETTLCEQTEALIMDALRQLDELRLIQSDLPSSDATVTLQQELESPLRDLSPEKLDLLQLAHNCKTVQEVLDASSLSDVDAAGHLLFLINKGYVYSR